MNKNQLQQYLDKLRMEMNLRLVLETEAEGRVLWVESAEVSGYQPALGEKTLRRAEAGR